LPDEGKRLKHFEGNDMRRNILSGWVITCAILAMSSFIWGQTPVAPTPPVPPTPPEVHAFPFSRGGFLGVGIREVTAQRAKELHLKEEAGVEITAVRSDSPAEKAGLKAGDVVLQYNGTRVEGFEQFSRMVRETPVGREAKLQVFRNGGEQNINVKIAQRGAPFVMSDGQFRIPDIPRIFQGTRSAMLGVEAESLEGQLADFFGVKEGVLVRSVIKGSAAEKAGMKAGDVITKVEDNKVTTPADITGRLRALAGKSVSVTLLREHKEMTLMVTMEAAERGQRFGRAEPAHFIFGDSQ
jgi:serine protease Do